MEKNSLLNVQDLKVKFYTYEGVVEALDGVNLDLKQGEILGVVGETGCGKSVTGLSILALIPSPGKIEGGKVILNTGGKTTNLLSLKETALTRIRGKDISMVFQDPRSALNPVYTAGDQIIEVLLHHRNEESTKSAIEKIDKEIKSGKASFLKKFHKKTLQKSLKNPRAFSLKIMRRIPILRGYKRLLKEEAKKEAINMLRIMKIPDPERVVDMYPHELSGGMAQRAVIAMAIACNPGVLIADEPTTNLDVTIQLQTLYLIKELKEKLDSSIIYVTHDMGVIAEICDRVAVMYAGNVVEIAEVVELFKNPMHPYTKALLESIPRPGFPFKSIEGVVPSLINPLKGCRFNDRCSYATEICRKEKPKMVEVKKGHFVSCFRHQ